MVDAGSPQTGAEGGLTRAVSGTESLDSFVDVLDFGFTGQDQETCETIPEDAEEYEQVRGSEHHQKGCSATSPCNTANCIGEGPGLPGCLPWNLCELRKKGHPGGMKRSSRIHTHATGENSCNSWA